MLETLVDRAEGKPLPLSDDLRERYGGPLPFPETDRPYVYANFVSTIDGVVSYAIPGRAGAALISERFEDDRFMLGLLRACADVVIVGAGTLREEGKRQWTAEYVYPPGAAGFAALRAALRKPLHPLVVFVTESGNVDLGLPAFRSGGGVVIVTGEAGARRIGRLPENVRVHAIPGDERPSARAIVDAAVAESGGRAVLTEGGPLVLGEFLRAGVVDELFLTVAPRLAGRSAEERRVALVEGSAFLPEDAPRGRLLSLKCAGDYLFTRYAFR